VVGLAARDRDAPTAKDFLGRLAGDFGSFEADGQMIMFKIDYYDQNMAMHSPDPADPSVTERVITIMLADEY
jgi:Protein of unknown function (DUF3768)